VHSTFFLVYGFYVNIVISGLKKNLIHFDHKWGPLPKKSKKMFCPDITFYAPIKSPHRVDTRYADLKIFKVILRSKNPML
jgi:hypothetical protein